MTWTPGKFTSDFSLTRVEYLLRSRVPAWTQLYWILSMKKAVNHARNWFILRHLWKSRVSNTSFFLRVHTSSSVHLHWGIPCCPAVRILSVLSPGLHLPQELGNCLGFNCWMAALFESKFMSSLSERHFHVHHACCLEQCLAKNRYSLDCKNWILLCNIGGGGVNIYTGKGVKWGRARSSGWGHRFYTAKGSDDDSGAVTYSPSGLHAHWGLQRTECKNNKNEWWNI